jgi:hypothetical protein
VHCGQAGRVARVFWRAGVAWVLVRGDDGQAFAIPWAATDLPIPVGSSVTEPNEKAPLLSPAALQALARFVCQRRHRRAQEGGADA